MRQRGLGNIFRGSVSLFLFPGTNGTPTGKSFFGFRENAMQHDLPKGFGYEKLPYRYVAKYENGSWQKGELTDNANVVLNESACVLHYAQSIFEGLKAYRTKEGKIVCFRPDLNEARLKDSAERMMIPPLPEGMFLEAVRLVVKANEKFIPPYGSGGSLYLRPIIYGTSPVLGVKPAKEFEFRLFASPVASYFHKAEGIRLRVSDFDRAAPHGTGHIKAGLNYAMSLYPISDAHAKGFDENLYPDPATRNFIEETGGANILFVKGNTLVTPLSPSILPSITRRSLLFLAKNYLKMETEERKIALSELGDFEEAGLCGTAAVISPVREIVFAGISFRYSVSERGKLQALSDLLKAIQAGDSFAPDGWLYKI